MGLFDGLKKKAEEKKAEQQAEQGQSGSSEAKFDKPCSLCGKAPTDTKWMGQFWHKRCKRSAKRLAGKMV